MEHADEVMVLCKIRKEDFDEVRSEIEELHPYETPCIELLDVSDCNRPCVEWVRDSTAGRRADSGHR